MQKKEFLSEITNGSDQPFYVTTPIYYVNANPHIGTLYSTLIADILARRARSKNRQTFFLTGLDEHGQKIAAAANAAQMTPQAFVDSMTLKFQDVWKFFDISYDYFVRTTSDKHKKAVTKAVEELLKKGHIYKGDYCGYYCVHCETFVPGYDQKVQEEVLCQTCSRVSSWNTEEAYFFKLSAYNDQLIEFLKNNPKFIVPEARAHEVLAFVNSGLSDLCISRRTNKWGIPFPQDPDHTIYVWIDALVNYISAIGYGTDEFEKQSWWPCDVHVLAKDIVKFHAVFWPALLMALGLALPKQLLVHGYILVQGDKMSKSKGNSVDPLALAQTYGVDQIRYYLARKMPISSDGNFTIEDLQETLAADLANNLGNLLSRICAVADKRGLTAVSEVCFTDPGCVELGQHLEITLAKVDQYFNDFQIHMALSEVFVHLSKANALVQACQPWREDFKLENLEQLLWAVCRSIVSIVEILSFVMPNKSAEILNSIGYKHENGMHFLLKKIATPLFAKDFIDQSIQPNTGQGTTKDKQEQRKVSEKTQADNLINFEDFAKVKIAVGTIEQCFDVDGSDKLYKLMVNFGELGVRQILSGIRKSFAPEDLIGRQACFVVNLEPRTIMSLQSNGMILTATGLNGKVVLVGVKELAQNGSVLR